MLGSYTPLRCALQQVMRSEASNEGGMSGGQTAAPANHATPLAVQSGAAA